MRYIPVDHQDYSQKSRQLVLGAGEDTKNM